MLQSLKDTPDLLVDMDEVRKVELAVREPVGNPVGAIPMIRDISDGIGNKILVHPVQESRRWMEGRMGLHIADVSISRLVGRRLIDKIEGSVRDPIGL